MMNLIDLKERVVLSRDFTPDETAFLLDAINTCAPRVEVAVDIPNTLQRIDRVWMWVSVDEGGEGVCAAPMKGIGTVPLLAADEARLASIRPIAERIAQIFQKPVRLVQFSERRELEVIEP